MNNTPLSDQRSYYFKNYYNENKNTILERLSINQQIRYIEDIEFKLLKLIQVGIKNELPHYNGTIEQLLGCSLSFLLKLIKFNTNKHPDWDNIHLHYVRPISTYKNNHHYSFHWTNLLAIDKHTNLSIKNTRNKYKNEQQLKRINKFLLATDISSNKLDNP